MTVKIERSIKTTDATTGDDVPIRVVGVEIPFWDLMYLLIQFAGANFILALIVGLILTAIGVDIPFH